MARLRTRAGDFFTRFKAREGRFPMQGLGAGLPLRRGPRTDDSIGDSYRALLSQLTVVRAGLASLPVKSDAIDALVRRATELHDELELILESDCLENVYWFECRGRGVFLWASPISIGPILSDRLFANVDTAVLTSATLSTGGDFRFIRSRVGLEQAEELILGSHFDFENQAILYIPLDIPEPREPEWVGRAALHLERILEASRGRAFVLFTSYNQMEMMVQALRGQRSAVDRVDSPCVVAGIYCTGRLTKPTRRGIMSISAIGGFIVLVADIYAIVQILQSSAKGIEKLLWVLVVFFLPLLGMIVWCFAGPGKKPF